MTIYILIKHIFVSHLQVITNCFYLIKLQAASSLFTEPSDIAPHLPLTKLLLHKLIINSESKKNEPTQCTDNACGSSVT